MKISKYKNIIFYIAFFLLLFKICYSTSDIFTVPDIMSKIFTVMIVLLFTIKIFAEKYNNKEKIMIIAIGIITMYTSYITKDYNVFLTFLLMTSLKSINLRDILKKIIIFFTIMLLVHIIVYTLMLIFDSPNIELYYTSDGEERYNLGLGHPNYASLIMFIVYMAFVYLNYNKKNLALEYIIGIIIIIIINFTTKSRTTMISIPIFMFLIYISRSGKNIFKNMIKICAKYIFIIFSIGIIIFLTSNSKYTKNDQKLDQIVSGRIWNMKKGFREDGISYLGHYIDRKDDRIILDNVYAKIIINYGIVYLFILSYLLVSNSKKMTDKDNAIMIIFCIVGMTEYLIVNTCISVPLIILGDCIFNRNSGDEKNEISNCNYTSI